MTGEKLRTEAIRYNGFNITEDDAIAYLNESLRRLGDMGLVYGQIDVSAQAGVGYALPPDLLHVVRVETQGSRLPYDGFRMVADEILFNRNGDFTIYARRMPSPMEFIDEEPDVPVLFHNALLLFLRGMTKLQDDETSQDGHMLVQQFEEEAAKAFRSLQRKSSPRQVRVIR